MPKHVGNQNSNNKNCLDRLLLAHSENCHVGLLISVCLLVVRCFGPAALRPLACCAREQLPLSYATEAAGAAYQLSIDISDRRPAALSSTCG